MRRIFALSFALSMLLAPAANAQSPEPVIRPGVTVAGLDVGGQTLSQAAGTIDRAYRHQLVTRNVSVRVGGKAYSLKTKKVAFVFDASKSARRAYIAGNDTRRARSPSTCCRGRATTQKKLAAFVARVDRSARVAPRDATVRITLQHMIKRSSQSGREMDDKGLSKALALSLADPRAPRQIRPKRAVVKAKVRTKDLANRYGTVVTISQSSFRLRLFKRLKFVKSYGVAVGQSAYPTPRGLFSIANKAVDPPWTAPEQPVGRRLPQRDRRGRLRREPAEGALDGHRQRRRHPRHRRARLDRLARLPRLHPHDRARRDRPLSARAASARRC